MIKTKNINQEINGVSIEVRRKINIVWFFNRIWLHQRKCWTFMDIHEKTFNLFTKILWTSLLCYGSYYLFIISCYWLVDPQEAPRSHKLLSINRFVCVLWHFLFTSCWEDWLLVDHPTSYSIPKLMQFRPRELHMKQSSA